MIRTNNHRQQLGEIEITKIKVTYTHEKTSIIQTNKWIIQHMYIHSSKKTMYTSHKNNTHITKNTTHASHIIITIYPIEKSGLTWLRWNHFYCFNLFDACITFFDVCITFLMRVSPFLTHVSLFMICVWYFSGDNKCWITSIYVITWWT